jgi:hypothetical protein
VVALVDLDMVDDVVVVVVELYHNLDRLALGVARMVAYCCCWQHPHY